MKLFNKTIDRQLFKQYSLGSDLSKQEVVVKIFNPTGAGNWFILNSDPEDPDYLWAIVDLGYGAEVGSVSRNDLETYRGRFGLGFERDLGFDPINAEELYQGLRNGEYYADGGEIEVVYERSVGSKKPIKLLLLNKGKEQKGYTFSGKDQVAVLENYNRNKQEDLERLWNLKGYETKYADGGEVSSRLSNNFLIVKIKGKTYKTWFPNWLSINKNFLEKLNKENKSVLIVEEENGNSKQFEVPNRDLMDIWLNDKSDKKTRDVLIQKAIEYNNNSFADGGSFDENIEFKDVSDEYGEKYEVFVNGILQGNISKSDDKYFVNSASTRGGKSYPSKFFESKDKAKKYIYSKTKELYGIGSVKKLMGYAKGGNIADFTDNQQMIMNQNVELEHHHEELEDILEDKVPVPAWVVAKMETATQNLSDITHYLDGQKEIMEDQLEEDDDDDDDEEMETEEIENKEVVEPIVVTAGDKTEITKNFTDDAWDNLRGFLKGMEGIDLRDDYTFDYKDEQYEVEPIINSDENGVSNAVFTIFDGDGEEVGDISYIREGGKQKFNANSEFFSWNNAKFEDGGFMNNVYADGGYFDGAIPKTSSYMNTYADGGNTAIDNLNKNTELREKMISYIVNMKSTSRMSDRQYDALEKRISEKSFAQLKKEYDALKGNSSYDKGGSLSEKEQILEALESYDSFNNEFEEDQQFFVTDDLLGFIRSLKVSDKESIVEALSDYDGDDFVVTSPLLSFVENINVSGNYAKGGSLGTVNPKYKNSILSMINYKIDKRIGDSMSDISYTEALNLKNKINKDEPISSKEKNYISEMASYLSSKRLLDKVANISYTESFDFFDNIVSMAKGGMVVTSVKDIPNFKERLKQGRITYRGLGMGKLANDFYKLAGTSGTRIKVDKKEYFITDEEFDMFSRDSDGKMIIKFEAPARKGYADGGFMNGVYEDGGFLDKYEVDRFKQVMNGKAIAKYIVRLQDSFGNKETYVFGIKLKDQFKGCELVPYEVLYGSWSDSGTPFALSNLQVKRLVPNSFSNIELDEQETEMLVNKLVNKNQAGVEKFLNSQFFYLNYNQTFKDVLRGHLALSIARVSSIEFEIVQKFADGGQVRSFDGIFGKEIIFKEEQVGKFTIGISSGFNNRRHVFIYEGEVGRYGGKGLPKDFNMSPQLSAEFADNFYSNLKRKVENNQDLTPFELIKEVKFLFADGGFMNDVYAKGGSIKKDWWQTVVNPNEDFHNYDNRKPIDWEVDDFKEWVVSNSDLDGNVDKEVLDVIKMPKSKLTVEYLNKNGSGKNNNEYYKEFGNWQSALYDIFTQMKKDYLFKKSRKYILKADIKTVTVKRKGKELTYNASDVLNGAYVLAKGGDMTSKANYVGKNDVVEVELKDGSKVKPANGYWIKKGAEPIGAEPTPTTSGKSEPKVGQTYIRKDMRGNWKAETNVDNFNDYDWRVSTIKTYSGKLISSAQGGKTELTGSKGIVMFKYTMYEDPNYTLEVSQPSRLTEKVVTEQHEKALAKFKKFMETGMFKGGGKISNFDKLSAKVAKQYEGKPVKSQYQEEYGKFYSKEEAQEVGDKVAGKVKAMQQMSNGGAFPDYGIVDAKDIDYDMISYFHRTNKKLLITTKDKKVSKGGVTKFYNDLIFTSNEKFDIPKKDILKVEILKDSMSDGGGTKKATSGSEMLKQANILAKEIRKDGESWNDAKKRAFAQLKK